MPLRRLQWAAYLLADNDRQIEAEGFAAEVQGQFLRGRGCRVRKIFSRPPAPPAVTLQAPYTPKKCSQAYYFFIPRYMLVVQKPNHVGVKVGK